MYDTDLLIESVGTGMFGYDHVFDAFGVKTDHEKKDAAAFVAGLIYRQISYKGQGFYLVLKGTDEHKKLKYRFIAQK